MRTIPQLCKMIHDNAVAKDLVPGDRRLKATEIGRLMQHVFEEMVAANNELIKNPEPDYYYYGDDGKPEGFRHELADMCILIFEIAQGSGINLYRAIREKMDYFEKRTDCKREV